MMAVMLNVDVSNVVVIAIGGVVVLDVFFPVGH